MYKNQYYITNLKLSNNLELNSSNFNNLNVYSHPSLSLMKEKYQFTEILLIGYILDPLKPELKEEQIIQDLAKKCNTKELLFRQLQLLSGRFIILYKNDIDFIAIGDTCYLRQLYYSFINEDIKLTSSQKMFLDLYGKTLVISDLKHKFMNMKDYKEHEYAWYGDESFDDRLKKVLPNHFLDIKNKKIERTTIFLEELVNEEDALSYCAEMLKGSINAITRRFKVLQAITAGTDTRTLLAASREFQDTIQYYNFDNSTIDKVHFDTWVPQKLSIHLGFCLQTIRPGRLREEFLTIYKREHVFPRILPQLNQIQYHYYNYSNIKAVRICGFGGEIGRGRVGHTKRKIDANLLKYFFGYTGKSEYVNKAIDSWLEDARDYSKQYNISLLDLFYWEQQMGNWGAMYPFEQDIAIEEFCPWYNKNLLLSILRTDTKKRSFFRSPFHLDLIKYLWPEALKYPVNPVGFTGYISGILGRNTMFRYYKIKFKTKIQSYRENINI